ncbi:MAG TPA: nucleotidyltransferase domain-containing protein [Bacteroidales bacterium]|nr:nucleotidyltransferase domain-containing protein [Bacteroidales bacterium]
MNLIKQHKSKLISLCKKYKVNELYAFGSVLTDMFNKHSDIDFLVKFGDVKLYDYFDNYIEFKESLENLFKRKVDLLEIQTLKNPILRRSIDRNKIKVYGRADSKMAV